MTTKPTAPPPYAPPAQFPERPPRLDMQNVLYLAFPGHHTALIRHLAAEDTTLVIGEMPVGWNLSQQSGLLYPDLMIAFNVNTKEAIALQGFGIDYQGKPPEFVLEVASSRTALNDYTTKRKGYAAFGIPEYWRFDPTGNKRYPVPLAGDRLVNGEYQPITIVQTDQDRYWGHSDALNLDLCWEYGQLRWYDPVSQRYLLTHDEVKEQLDAERNARIAAEAQLDAERDTRIAERNARIAAEARAQQLEQELRRRSP